MHKVGRGGKGKGWAYVYVCLCGGFGRAKAAAKRSSCILLLSFSSRRDRRSSSSSSSSSSCCCCCCCCCCYYYYYYYYYSSWNLAPLAPLGGRAIASNLAILVSNGRLVGKQLGRVGQARQHNQDCKIAAILVFPPRLTKFAKLPRFTLQ